MLRSIVSSVNRQSLICINPKFSRSCNNILLKLFSTNPDVDTKIEKKEKRIRHTKDKSIVFPNNLNIFEAVKELKKYNWAKFNETIEIAVNLGVDPRKPNQSIKGMAKLPQGTGKIVRVAVFAKGSDAVAAEAAGAEIVGSDDLLAKVQAGEINFDTLISTPEMMPFIGKIGKILGPRGLMPNPKMGTVTKDVTKAIKAAKTGRNH
jgi:ribosomal protein L1